MVCGQDVSSKPRVKDNQGRYLCVGACQKKYQTEVPPVAPKAAPSARPQARAVARDADLDNGLMNDLVASSPMISAKRCDSCGNPLMNNAIVCLSCGFNSATGKAMKTRVSVDKIKEPKAPKIKGSRYSTSEFGPSFGVLFLIVLVPLVALALLGAVNPVFLVLSFVLAWLGLAIGNILGIIAAFRNDESGWGLCGILSFFVPFLGLVFLYYLLVGNSDKWSKSIFVGSFVAMILGAAVLVGVVGIDAFEKASGISDSTLQAP